MTTTRLLMVALLGFTGASLATDYTVDFTRVKDLESLRPLVQNCADFDALEHYRDKLEATANLETMRKTLTDIGFAMFNDCPEAISGAGIAPVMHATASTTIGYSVDFTRVQDLESLRALVENCADFGALEHYREKLQTTANLEAMRKTLIDLGFGMFDECPANISGPGITPVN